MDLIVIGHNLFLDLLRVLCIHWGGAFLGFFPGGLKKKRRPPGFS